MQVVKPTRNRKAEEKPDTPASSPAELRQIRLLEEAGLLLRVSKQQLNKLEKVVITLENREEGRLAVGTVPRPVLRNHLPLQRPDHGYLVHSTHDGNCELTVTADPRYGMPFGRDPLVQLWLFSEAVEQKSPTIRFKSGRQMLRSMGLDESTKNLRWAKQAVMRNFGATWELSIEHKVGDKIKQELHWFRLVKGATLWFNERDRQLVLENCENTVTLTEDAYALALKKGYQARFEIETVAALSHSPGAMRLFLILRDRCGQLEKRHDWIPITGHYGLDAQLGVKPYSNQRRWRQNVRRWLTEVQVFWPNCPTEIHAGRDGFHRLKITPSRPA